MYTKFYGLNKKPFESNLDSRFLYLGEKHREALALMIMPSGKGRVWCYFPALLEWGKQHSSLF